MKSGQSWVPVCNSSFTAETALVACRDLGCGVPENVFWRDSDFFLGKAVSGRSLDFSCNGTEEHLMDCSSTVINSNITDEGSGKCYDVNITCSGKNQDYVSLTMYASIHRALN